MCDLTSKAYLKSNMNPVFQRTFNLHWCRITRICSFFVCMEKWKKRDYLLIQNKKRSTASNIRVNLWTELFSSAIHFEGRKGNCQTSKTHRITEYKSLVNKDLWSMQSGHPSCFSIKDDYQYLSNQKHYSAPWFCWLTLLQLIQISYSLSLLTSSD